jgi:protein-tyrosine-phosphatase
MARPRAVLFACQMNAVRSPMAAALMQQMFPGVRVASVGVAPGDLDPFAVVVMEELGIDIAKHRPIDFEDYEDLEGLDFDLIVTLSPGAHHKAISLSHRIPAEIEYWPTPDPTDADGSRDQRLGAYREVRDLLAARIRERFGAPTAGAE